MKRLLVVFVVFASFAACNNGEAEKKEKSTGKAADVTVHPDYQKGLELVATHKCLTCHAIDETITGPAYREVAKKYANSPDTIIPHLVGKIINGSSGVWGDLMMTPNSNVTPPEAEAMVKYILLLKK